jgi:hypothetical protein
MRNASLYAPRPTKQRAVPLHYTAFCGRCHRVNAYVSAPTSIMRKSFSAGHQYQWRAENELSYSLHAAVVKENVDATVLRDCLRFNDTTACSFPVGTSSHRVITRSPRNVTRKEGRITQLMQASFDREVALHGYYTDITTTWRICRRP